MNNDMNNNLNKDKAGREDQWIRVLSIQESQNMSRILDRGLGLVEDISQKLQTLSDLMLTGKPHEIADAAMDIEIALQSASPAFADISQAMEFLGAGTLQDAALKLRQHNNNAGASLAEALRAALAGFARRSVDANRRAAQLNRGINSALKSLQALGVQENGRLIAEA